MGITFVYVTHDQEEALTMSDRIAVMSEGVIQQCGVPEEIYERPVGPFVAGFIGVSNLLPGVAENLGVRLDGGQLCKADVPGDVTVGSPVQLSVRPEKIWLDQLEPGMVSLEGSIVERVYVGTTTQVIVELEPGVRLVALEQNTARVQEHDRWKIGDRVRLWLASGALAGPQMIRIHMSEEKMLDAVQAALDDQASTSGSRPWASSIPAVTPAAASRAA